MFGILILTLLDAAAGAVALWLAGRLTDVQLALKETTVAAGVAALLSLIPQVGWLLSIVALFYLLRRFSRADIWPDLILLVLVSRLLALVAVLALGGFG